MLTDDEILDLVRECDLDWHAGWAGDDEDNRYTRLARAIEAALAAAPQREPVGWMWQHDETGRVGFVDPWQLENGWGLLNPRCKLIHSLYTAPQPSAKDDE